MGKGNVGSLYVNLIAETAQFRKEMRESAAAFNHEVAAMRQQSQDFADGIFGMMAGFSIGSLVNDIIRASDESQNAEAQVRAGLLSTGNAAGRTFEQIRDSAAELQASTRFEDDAVLQMESVLLTFTRVRNDVFDSATKSIADMATRMNSDLKSAALQVGKALNDPIAGLTGLSKAGVQFSAAQKDSIKSMMQHGQMADAQRMILKELETQFGGSAAAARHTLGGAIEALKNNFGNLFELTNEQSAPFLSTIEYINEHFDTLGVGIKAAAGFMLGAGGFVAAINAGTFAVRMFTAAAMSNPYMAIGTIVAGLAANYLIFKDSVDSAVTSIFDSNTALANSIDVYDRLSQKTNLTTQEQNQLNASARRINEILPSAAIQFNQYGDAIRGSAAEMRKLREETEKVNFEKAKILYVEQWGQKNELIDSLNEQKQRFDDTSKAIDSYYNTLRSTNDISKAYDSAVQTYPKIKESAEFAPFQYDRSNFPLPTMEDQGKQLKNGLLEYLQIIRNKAGIEIDSINEKIQSLNEKSLTLQEVLSGKTTHQNLEQSPAAVTPPPIDNPSATTKKKTEISESQRFYQQLLDQQNDYNNRAYLASLSGYNQQIETQRLETANRLREVYDSAAAILAKDETTIAERIQIQSALWPALAAIAQEGNAKLSAIQSDYQKAEAEKIKEQNEKIAASLQESRREMMSIYSSLEGGLPSQSPDSFLIRRELLGNQISEYQAAMNERTRILRETGATEQQISQENARFESILNQYQLEEFKRIKQEELLALGSFADGASVYYQRLRDNQYTAAQVGLEAMQRINQAMEDSFSDAIFNTLTGKFSSLQDVVQGFAESIVRAFADITAKIVAQKIMMAILSKSMSAASIAATAAEASATAAAWAPAAALASLATMGANAAPAGAALSGTVALSQSLSLLSVAGFAEGGIVRRPTLALIGEAGYDEAVIPLDRRGKDFLAESTGASRSKPSVVQVDRSTHLHNPTFMNQEVLAQSMRTIAISAVAEDYDNDGLMRRLMRAGD